MQFSNYDHTDHTHMCDILQIRDKQLEILVLLKYHVLHITVHRHTTIMTNETFVNSTVGSYRRSSDRAVNANGDQVIIVHMVTSGMNCIEVAAYMSSICGMPQGIVTHKSILDFKTLLLNNLFFK